MTSPVRTESAPPAMVAASARAGIRPWYRDAISCLHATLGVVVARAGGDPLEVCGLAWEVRYRPGGVRGEEFYWPAPDPADPVASLAPWHPVRSRWRRATGAQPLDDLAAALSADRLPVAAVDNYHLPFRPAYHDVHAAHLLVVHAIDTEAVYVCDPVPPAYQGPVGRSDFLRSWGSGNPADAQDPFFSSTPIGHRWLDVTVTGPIPPVSVTLCATALRANLTGLRAAPAGPDRTGLAGLVELTEELTRRLAAGDRRAGAELYVRGWCLQAQSALHGELLRRLGGRWSVPELAEAGRRVEQVAHAWTAVRVAGAHAAAHGGSVDLAGHPGRLHRYYQTAMESVGSALAALDTGSEPAP